MFFNYLKFAIRGLKKQKLYSGISILGLTIGMTAFLMIVLYLHFEYSYDRFHKNSKQIYRLHANWFNEEEIVDRWAYIPPAFGPAIKQEFPEVLALTRILNSSTYSLIHDQEKLHCDQVMFVDPDFFDIFSFHLIHGNPRDVLQAPDAVVISRRIADKLFAGQNPLGQPLAFFCRQGQIDCMVTGVFENIPQNSHLQTDYFITYQSLVPIRGKDIDDSWYFSRVYTYILLDGKNPASNLEAKLPALIKRNRDDKDLQIVLQPLRDIHLHSNLTWDTDNGNASSIYFLIIIAFLILIMAWINHVNISTAKTTERAREVGIKKLIGSSRLQMGFQFLVEFFIHNTLAIMAALALLFFLLPVFNQLTGIILFQAERDGVWFSVLLAILFITSILCSGLYPSWLLSSHKPLGSAKGEATHSKKGIRIRNALMVAQFIASIILIAGTLIVFKQMQFINKQDLGINIHHTLVLNAPVIQYSKDENRYTSQIIAFKNSVSAIPGVESITSSFVVPGGDVPSGEVRRQDKDIAFEAKINSIDYAFLPAYEVKILAGRNFDPMYGSDEEGIILNEKAAQLLGYLSPAKALNQVVVAMNKKWHVVGVVKDYHQLSLKKASLPLVFTLEDIGQRYYSIKINPTGFDDTYAKIRTEWNRSFTVDPFDPFFLEDHYNEQYRAEETFQRLFGIFCILSILISCLGLFSLSHYVIRVRTKEIGIRKVVGASVSNILILLTKDFTKWIVLANVIAWPIAWYALNKWLQNFAYRIDLTIWPFLLSGLLALLIALLTVSWQAIRAAMANPVEALRYE